jgi:hypothetical protein
MADRIHSPSLPNAPPPSWVSITFADPPRWALITADYSVAS